MSLRPGPEASVPRPHRSQGPSARRRLALVAALLGLASVGLVARAIDLQVVRKKFLQEQGDARFLREVPIPVSRGTIFDRNGEPLAVSTPVESLWANPQVLLQHADRIAQLAKALGADPAELQRRLEQRDDREFVYLKRQMSPEAADAVLAMGIPGVNRQREYRRYYPSGEVSAHVIGFTNIDDRGQEGLELAFDGWLAGKPGLKRVIRDRLGHVVENVDLLKEPHPGRDLTLTIDRRIQYLAYRELAEAVLAHQASSGSMVVLDARTGEILAMVNQPSYNPNNVNGSNAAQRRNRAVTDVFEPGSVMKAFTISAALESGQWTPTSPIDTSPGYYTLAGHEIQDVEDHGKIDVTQVITYSSNVGASKIAITLPKGELYDVDRRFGFGTSTGSGFPGEASGLLPDGGHWSQIRTATIAYGYGLNVTALQLAQGYAAIADGGVLHTPTFVKGEDSRGNAVIDPAIARAVIRMLETVVSPQGTALKAAIPNYTVAGKTGTAHIAAAGGYENQYESVFVGMVPATDPRLVGVVVIRDPTKGGYYGGIVSAPVFSAVMDGALRLLDVPPDNVQRWYAGGPAATQPIRPGSPAPDYAPGATNYKEGTP